MECFELWKSVIMDQSVTFRKWFYNVCSVLLEVFNAVGGYLEYRRGCSGPWWDIMIIMGD